MCGGEKDEEGNKVKNNYNQKDNEVSVCSLKYH